MKVWWVKTNSAKNFGSVITWARDMIFLQKNQWFAMDPTVNHICTMYIQSKTWTKKIKTTKFLLENSFCQKSISNFYENAWRKLKRRQQGELKVGICPVFTWPPSYPRQIPVFGHRCNCTWPWEGGRRSALCLCLKRDLEWHRVCIRSKLLSISESPLGCHEVRGEYLYFFAAISVILILFGIRRNSF